ncbi:MAG: acyl-CoA dehydrogenase family protein [Flammeovirgaceae bacterium]
METLTKAKTALKGGEFLIKDSQAADVFITKDFTENDHMMRQSAIDFVEQEVLPRIEEIDAAKDLSIVNELLNKCAELGFLGIGVPESYGGFDISFASTLFVGEEMGKAESFALSIGVQTSIGIAPILFAGSEAQKAKYLPKLVTAELKTCYCLTEPTSGSDANSARTQAVLSEDGTHYVLNGQKMWITNAGIADLFIVFAKIEDDANLTAFIVEKDFGGITLGAEERKLGIKGSSTRQVFFEEVKVPVENLLGERNKGFKLALNVLNTGRIKLGTSALGCSKAAFDLAVNYANQRKQFGQSISSFGAIQHKLGEMAARMYALEAACYRTGHLIDLVHDEMVESGMDIEEAKYKSVEEFAIECAMLKILGSETQDFVVDEGVQIYGGMGFSEEAPMARLYRNSRINRIFEGTNEINRMLTIDMMMKKAMRGKLDLMQPAKAVAKELTSIPSFGATDQGLFAEEQKVLQNLKKVGLMVAGRAAQKLMMKLAEEQEILMNLADILIEIYAFESALLRTIRRVEDSNEVENALQIELTRIYMHRAVERIQHAAKEVICGFAEGDELKMMLMGLKRFTKVEPYNLKEARRKVASKVIEKNKFCF